MRNPSFYVIIFIEHPHYKIKQTRKRDFYYGTYS
nr:MAG TPA: hypothetical protein [Caudoviricetes sp.]